MPSSQPESCDVSCDSVCSWVAAEPSCLLMLSKACVSWPAEVCRYVYSVVKRRRCRTLPTAVHQPLSTNPCPPTPVHQPLYLYLGLQLTQPRLNILRTRRQLTRHRMRHETRGCPGSRRS
jgi:hypothetical protein